MLGQFLMGIRVQGQTSSVKQFMGEGVAVKGFIFQERRMQSNGDVARGNAQFSTAKQFCTSFLKASHAQAVIIYGKPLEGVSVCNPWNKDGVYVPRKCRYYRVDQVFWDDWR